MQHLVGKRVRGEIRSWKGDWGFVVCPQKFQGDLFVHRQSMQMSGEITPGRVVSFTIAIDQKRRITAIEATEPNPAPEDFAAQGQLSGVIRSWKKDWGFIVAPEFEGDLFCHIEHIQREGLPEQLDGFLSKRFVTFEVSVDKRGRACAINIAVGEIDPNAPEASPQQGHRNQGAIMPMSRQQELQEAPGAGGFAGSEVPPGQLLQGTLRSWREPWGFAVSPEAFAGDLFCHRDSFVEPPPQVNLTGCTVQFTREQDSRGRWHAANVQILSTEGIVEQPQAGANQGPIGAGGRGRMLPPPPPALAKPAGTGALEERFAHLAGMQIQGEVKSWKNEWGFIVSPENFEGDLFCHKENLQNGADHLSKGARIHFQVATDSRGRSTAQQVVVANEPAEWVGSVELLRGIVRSFKNPQPWGFLVSPASFNGDLFFHADSFGGAIHREQIGPGLQVAFRVNQDQQGRLAAQDICFDGTAQVKRPAMMGIGPGHAKRPRM